MTQQAAAAQPYVIPSFQRPNAGRMALVFPTFAAIGYVVGLSLGGTWTGSLYAAAVGLPVAILFFVIGSIVVGALNTSRQMRVWAKHTFAWYRETFPSHAHPNGHVSCRHCGSHKTDVRNLMNRTFMRVHSCSQCGETLYFSPEKV
jgi:hypothetical protein